MKAADNAIPPHPGDPETGPLSAVVDVIKKKARTSKRDYPRGDADNFVKAALDVIVKKGYIRDDDQIVALEVTKRFADADERPRTDVWLYRVDL